MMRLLWASDAPWSQSGYGVQTAITAPRLQRAGLADVALLTTYGLQGAALTWEGLKVYPGGADPFANDVIGQSARDWRADVVVTLKDSFVFKPEAFQGLRWTPLVPIDHEPAPPAVVAACRHAYRPIAYAPNGVRALRLAGLDPLYAPHGYDPATFYPEDKAAARAALGLPQDRFIVGTVAVNRGGIPSRKAWDELIHGVGLFRREACPDLLYLAHTYAGDDGFEGALPLRQIAHEAGIADAMVLPQPDAYRAGFPPDHLRRLYSAMDVLLCVSLGEGFGIPTLEAQACFPADTPISANDIAEAKVRKYTGQLIRIETERGTVIEVTAEHPFWTNRGWVKAKDLDCGLRLLYTGDYEKGLDNLFTGRIGDVTNALFDRFTERVGPHPWAQPGVGKLATTSNGVAQIICRPDRIETRFKLPDGISLPGWAYRWRGDGFYSEVAEEVEAAYSDREWGVAVDGMATVEVFRAFDIHRAAASEEREGGYALHVPYRGDFVPSTVRGPYALHGAQARAYGTDGRIQSRAPDAEPDGRAHSTPIGDYRAHQGAQYEAIRSVSSRFVEDLPVYNLTTASGIYQAHGYLVHNCGTPVIAGRWAAQEDLIFAGWGLDRSEAHRFRDGQMAYVYVPSPHAIADRLRQAHEAWKAGAMGEHRAAALAGAAPFQIDRIVAEHWAPALRELEAQIREDERRPRGVLRVVMPQEVLGA